MRSCAARRSRLRPPPQAHRHRQRSPLAETDGRAGGAPAGRRAYRGALIGFGIPEYEAKRYEGRVQKGGILLSVHCESSDAVKRAKEIMKITNAEDISSTGESSADVKADDQRARHTTSGSRE